MSRPGTYTGEQKTLRRALLAVYSPAQPCPRCGRPLGPNPNLLDLGHTDDRSAYTGLEHSRCNRGAGARLGNARRRAAREETRIMVTDVCLGIEVSQDRTRCSVVAAGHLERDLILLDLVAYLVGTDPIDAVLQIRRERTVRAVVVDPHGPAATAIRPLEAAGVEVTKPTSSDLVVAHGLFVDAANAGRIRHQRQTTLSSAIRHLEQRRLGGADAPERRGARGDVSPAIAGELAAWALETAPKGDPAVYVF